MEIAIVGASGVGKTSNLAYLLDRLNFNVNIQDKILWASWLDEEEEKALRGIEEWTNKPGERKTMSMVASVLSQGEPTLVPEDCYVKILHHKNGNPVSHTVRFRDIPGRHFESVADWTKEQNMLKKHLQESAGIILYIDASSPPDIQDRNMWDAYAQSISQFTERNKNYPVWFCLTKADMLSEEAMQVKPEECLAKYGQRLQGLVSLMKAPKFFTYNTIKKEHQAYENSGNFFFAFYMEAIKSLEILRKQARRANKIRACFSLGFILMAIFLFLEAWDFRKSQNLLSGISLQTLCDPGLLEQTSEFLDKTNQKKAKIRLSYYSYNLFDEKMKEILQGYEKHLDQEFSKKIGKPLEEKEFDLELAKPLEDGKEFLKELQEKQNFLETYIDHKTKIGIFLKNPFSPLTGDYQELTKLLKAAKDYEQKKGIDTLLFLTKIALYFRIISNTKESKNYYLVDILRYIRLQWDTAIKQQNFPDLLEFQKKIQQEISSQQTQGQKEIALGFCVYQKQTQSRLEALWEKEWEQIKIDADKMSPRWQEQPKRKLEDAWKRFLKDPIRRVSVNSIPDKILKEFTTEVLQSWTAMQESYVEKGKIGEIPVSQNPVMMEYKKFLQGLYDPDAERERIYEEKDIFLLTEKRDNLTMQEKMLLAFYSMVYSPELLLDVKEVSSPDYEKKIEKYRQRLEASLEYLSFVPDAQRIWKQRIEDLKSITSTRAIYITFPSDAFQFDGKKPKKEDCETDWNDETFDSYSPYLRIIVTTNDSKYPASNLESSHVMWNTKSTVAVQWMDNDNGQDGSNLSGDDDVMKSLDVKILHTKKYSFRKEKFTANFHFDVKYPSWIQAYFSASDK